MKIDDEYITVIASAWAYPLADLASAWRKRIEQKGDASHLTQADRGTCYAMILMLIVMLESYSLRAAIDIATDDVADSTADTDIKDEKVVTFFDVRKWWEQSEYCDKEKVIDLFVVRDVLAHNHLYSYSLGKSGAHSPTYSLISRGDTRFRARVLDGKLLHTGMSCVPETIGPKEVLMVADITQKALRYLSKNYQRVSSVDFNFVRRGASRNLWEGIEDAASAANALNA